jgi:transcriptional regulator GlxA family with amidase domain
MAEAAETQTARVPKLRIGIVLIPQFTLNALANFLDAIRLAGDEADRSRQIDCQWEILGSEEIVSSCGIGIRPWGPMIEPGRFDYIVVIGGLLHGGQRLIAGTRSFLELADRQGVALVGLCTASFVLARCGLMDGYEACVAWLHRDEYEAEFPGHRVQSDRMYVIDRDRITCPSGAAVLHVAARLIEKHCGRSQALKSMRIMLEELPLPAGAWQPEEILTRQARSTLVRRAMLMIEESLSASVNLTDLAASLSVSRRKLERHFLADVGISPGDYKLRLRLARSKWLVEHTDRALTQIAFDCGFNDASYFSRKFKAEYRMLPTAARRAVQGA